MNKWVGHGNKNRICIESRG